MACSTRSPQRKGFVGRSGLKRDAIVFQRFTETVGAGGQAVLTATNITNPDDWAHAVFLPGQSMEGRTGERITATTTVKFTTRYRSDITKGMQIVWRSRNFNIHSISPDERTDDMVLMTTEVQ